MLSFIEILLFQVLVFSFYLSAIFSYLSENEAHVLLQERIEATRFPLAPRECIVRILQEKLNSTAIVLYFFLCSPVFTSFFLFYLGNWLVHIELALSKACGLTLHLMFVFHQ